MHTIKLTKTRHPVYTSKLTTTTNVVSFDIRPTRDYLNRYVLLFRVMHPEPLINAGADLLSCSAQNDRIFETRKKAREYIFNSIINYL